MKRTMLFLLILVQCAVFAYYSGNGSWIFSLVIATASLAGLIIKVKLNPVSLTRFVLVTALLFVLSAYFFPKQQEYGFFLYFLTYVLAQFMLFLQCLYLFCHDDPWLDSMIPLAASLVMLHSGNVYMYGRTHPVYQLGVLLFGVFLVLYMSVSTLSRNRFRLKSGRYRALYLLLLLIITYISGIYIHRHGSRIDVFLLSLFGRISRFNFTTVATPGQLMDKSRMFDEEVALRILSDREPGYLRGMAYASYRHPSWKVAGSMREERKSDVTLSAWMAGGETELYEYTISGERDSFAETLEVSQRRGLGSGMFTRLDTAVVQTRFPSLSIDEHGIITTRYLAGRGSYLLLSGRQKQSIDPLLKEMCLIVPESVSSDIRKISDSVTGGAGGFEEKTRAVIAHLQEKHAYSLDAEFPEQANAVELFLTTDMDAHCEFFATGAALLLRMSGVPSRYVTGYLVNEWNPYGKYWFATNRSAHAWVEAYEEGQGWKLVEATPAGALPGESERSMFFYFMDALRYDYRIAFSGLASRGLSDLAGWIVSVFKRILRTLFSWPGAAMAAVLLFLLWFSLKIKKNRPPLYPVSGTVIRLHTLLSVLDRKARARGMIRAVSEPVEHFAVRLEGSGSKTLAELYRRYVRIRFRDCGDLERISALEKDSA